MAQINFATKEVNCKIVYFGPQGGGKVTNLEVIHQKAPENRRGELTAIDTEGDRTLFFDFLPLNLGKVTGMTLRFQLYSVAAQVYYHATRRLVLAGADGIVFVADSAEDRLEENLKLLRQLAEELKELSELSDEKGRTATIDKMPLVMQWDKRDQPNALPVQQLEETLNLYNAPSFEAVSSTGQGVFPTLKRISALILENLSRQHAAPDEPQKPKPLGLESNKEMPLKKLPEARSPNQVSLAGTIAASGTSNDIFLSYAKEDRPTAKLFLEALRGAAWTVWWDGGIPPGRRFATVIEAALESAKCVIVLWSEASVKSRWVNAEAGEGADRDILIPILIEDVKPPLEFRGIHTARMVNWRGNPSDKNFVLVVNAISVMVHSRRDQNAI